MLHQENAPAHSVLSVNAFFAKYGIAVLDQPPYSPDLASCNFLFLNVKSELKGTIFDSVEAVEAVKAKAMEVLINKLIEADF